MQATCAFALISQQLSGKGDLLFSSPRQYPRGFFLSLSSSLLSISYTGTENHQTEQLSISYTVYGLTLVSFFILSAWAPFIFSYMAHQSFPIFPGSPLPPAFRLPFYFSLSRCGYLFFSFRSRCRPQQPPLSAVIKAPRHGSGLYHPLNSSFFFVIWSPVLTRAAGG